MEAWLIETIGELLIRKDREVFDLGERTSALTESLPSLAAEVAALMAAHVSEVER